jgi:hypothetical protein
MALNEVIGIIFVIIIAVVLSISVLPPKTNATMTFGYNTEPPRVYNESVKEVMLRDAILEPLFSP